MNKVVSRSSLLTFVCLVAACASELGQNDAELGGAEVEDVRALASQKQAVVQDPQTSVYFLEQNWTAEDRAVWEHTPDGSGVIPLPWLLALEKLTSTDRFLTDSAKYGLIPDAPSTTNPLGLPVGLARQSNGALVGFTCSGCHEAQVTYQGKTIRIYGGQGKALVPGFLRDAWTALGATLQSLQTSDPSKFQRFAGKVLPMMGLSPTDPAAIQMLVAQIQGYLTRVVGTAQTEAAHGSNKLAWGPYRQDAMQSGFNTLSGMLSPDNIKPDDAAVSIPHLWETPHFNWVQYNGSFRQPMARNVISVIARQAGFTFSHDPAARFANTVDMNNLYKLETTLGKLEAPKWPQDLLGRIDLKKALRGAVLYVKERCVNCHNPGKDDRGLIKTKLYSIEELGTDPRMALNFADRVYDMKGYPGLDGQPLGLLSGPAMVTFVTQGVMERNYTAMGTPPELQAEMNGNNNAPNEWRAEHAYKARPLDGIWATAPYLHNGSVPTLYDLLLPVAQRPTKFKVGSPELDTVNVGLVRDGEFELDTSAPGNSNTGHTYGTTLDDQDRRALVEFLKVL